MASSFQCLNVHIVFATAGRAPTITDEMKGDLHAYMGGSFGASRRMPSLLVGWNITSTCS